MKINTYSNAYECTEHLWMATVAVSREIRVGGRFTVHSAYLLCFIFCI